MSQQKHGRAPECTARVISLTDSFMAIIMASLVLLLTVSQFNQNTHNVDIGALTQLLPELLASATSFIFIALYWVNHHRIFHVVKKTDTGLLWHNIHLLFWISLVPFVTYLLGAHPRVSLVVAMYSFVLFMVALTFHILLIYVYLKSGQLIKNDSPGGLKSVISQIVKSRISVFLHSLSVLTALIHPYVSFVFIFFVLMYSFLPRHAKRSNRE